MSASLSLFDRPAPPRPALGAFSMRPYQVAADAAIDRELSSKRSTLVVMATGTGKTVLFAHQAMKRGGALVIAHRDSLIQQAAAKLRKQLGPQEPVGIEKAERMAFDARFIVGSVQTLKGARLASFAKRFPSIRTVIIDEAHRAAAASYRAILSAFPEAQVIGVTATPVRADGIGLNNVFESVAFDYGIGPATDDGWLTPVKWVPISCSASLDGVKVKGRGETRDFDQGQLEDAIADCAATNVRALLDKCGDHRLLVFTPGVKTAHATAEAFNLARPGSALAVDGTMSDEEKADAVKRHQGGDVRYLANCGVYTEGYDDPTLDGIFDNAPTMSAGRARQKWGRATRLWPEGIEHLETAAERKAAIAASPKPWAMLYDLTFNMSSHGLVSPVEDMLSGKATEDEIKRVKEILEKQGGGNTDEMLADIRAEDAAERAMVAARAALIAARRKATSGPPKTIWELLGQKLHAPGERVNPENFATSRQFEALTNMGAEPPEDLTKAQASKMLEEATRRREAGLCNFRQLKLLARYGIDGTHLSFKRAGQVIDAIKDAGWHTPTPSVLSELLARQPGDDE